MFSQVDKECKKSVHSIPLLQRVIYHCSVHSFYSFPHHSQARQWDPLKVTTRPTDLKCNTLQYFFYTLECAKSGKPVAIPGWPGMLPNVLLVSPCYAVELEGVRLFGTRVPPKKDSWVPVGSWVQKNRFSALKESFEVDSDLRVSHGLAGTRTREYSLAALLCSQ